MGIVIRIDFYLELIVIIIKSNGTMVTRAFYMDVITVTISHL